MILQPLNCATPRYTRIGLRFAYKTPANFKDRQKVLKYGALFAQPSGFDPLWPHCHRIFTDDIVHANPFFGDL
jgi:hypothetical protein